MATKTLKDGSPTPKYHAGFSREEFYGTENGNVHSVLMTDRVDNEGKELPDTTDVWKRVTKGSEVLQQELSWIIGHWADEENGLGLNCQWAADGNVIEFRWSNPRSNGISIILWDGLLSDHGRRTVPVIVTQGVSLMIYLIAILVVMHFIYDEPVG